MSLAPASGLTSWLDSAQRKRLTSSLYLFAKEVLGYADLAVQPHEEICGFLERLTLESPGYQRKAMMLVPRGCFKTTLGSVALPILLLAVNPNLRILISSHTHEYSRQILDEIKWQLEHNEKLLRYFGDWKPGSAQWSDEGLIIGTRTIASKTPSIGTAGVDRAATGSHYDVIIADDLHSEKNIDSEGARRRVRRHLQTLYPILEPEGVLLVIGTRWHNDDAYGWLLKKDDDRRRRGKDPEWVTLVRAAYLANGDLYFPGRITEGFLSQQREALEDKFFSVWYLNTPIEEGAKIFPRAWWRFFDGEYRLQEIAYLACTEPKGLVPVDVTLAVDPAISSRRQADYTGLTVVGTSPEDIWFVLEAERIKGGPEKVIDAIVYFVRQYWPRQMTIETVAFQEAFRLLLLERFKREGIHLGIHEYRASLRISKRARIEALQPRFKQRRIFLRRGLDDLYRELDDYPELEHDDLLDSLAQHIAVSTPARALRAVESIDQEEHDREDDEPEKKSFKDGSWAGMTTPGRRVS